MHTLSRRLRRLPILGQLYARNSATLKRDVCLLLDRAGKLKPLTFVQWLATSACNAHCPFCEASAGRAATDELSTDEARSLIDDLAKMKVERLFISGGEPLMRRDIIDVMAYARRKGLSVGLASNGSLVEQRWQDLRELDFYLYFTSIDGPEPFHDGVRGPKGSFASALSGLRRFAEIGTPTRLVNTVVQPGNLHLLPDLLQIVRKSAATRWHLTPTARVGRASASDAFSLDGRQLRDVVEFIRSARSHFDVDLGEAHTYLGCLDGAPLDKPFFCGAGLTRCSIMSDGAVLPCQQIYDASFAEGSVRDQPFSTIWKEGFRSLRQRLPTPECADCQHLSACRCGCWAEMQQNGECLKRLWDGAQKRSVDSQAAAPKNRP